MISLLTDVEKVLQLSMLNARIKSSHLSNFMSYDRFWFVFSFHNHWKILVNNIHRSNVLRNTGNSSLCWLWKKTTTCNEKVFERCAKIVRRKVSEMKVETFWYFCFYNLKIQPLPTFRRWIENILYLNIAFLILK